MSEGFASRKPDTHDDSALLLRICNAYLKAKEKQASVSATFRVSNEWLPIYEKQLGAVMKALSSRDVETLGKIYKNFFRDSCSTGLVGLPVDMARHYFGPTIEEKYKHLFLIDMLHRNEVWRKETAGAFASSSMAAPEIGNPYGLRIDGEFIVSGSDYKHYYASKIGRLLSPQAPQVVAELGGGFGGMAYFLVRDNPQITYADFDLPENLALATYYLLKAFPTLPATLYGEAELTPATLKASRIVMMPSFEILNMPSESAQLVFNSYSLAEMSASAIREYVREMARTSNRYFLHVNHTRNSVVSADDFGIEDQGFKMVERKFAAWNQGLLPSSDEFEFLYERK